MEEQGRRGPPLGGHQRPVLAHVAGLDPGVKLSFSHIA